MSKEKWQPVDARLWMTERAWMILQTSIGRESRALPRELIDHVAEAGALLWGERIDVARTRDEFVTYLREAVRMPAKEAERAVVEVQEMTKRRTGR